MTYTVSNVPGLCRLCAQQRDRHIETPAGNLLCPTQEERRKLFEVEQPVTKYHLGEAVEKISGDYTYKGVVVAAFLKLSGEIRYVVEDERGLLFIFNERSLARPIA